MKKWKETLCVLVLFIIVLLSFLYELNTSNSIVQTKYDVIEKANDSLANGNSSIDNHIEKIQKKADALNQKIIEDTKIITTLKKTRNENLSRIDNASNKQLLEFFTKFKTQDSIY